VRALQANTQKFNTRADSTHLRTTVGISGGARCQPTRCVIDTGSDVSLLSFSAAVATGCLIETPKTMRLVVRQVQGEVMEFLGYVVAAWVLCGHMYPHIFLVPVEVEDEIPEYDALVGNDLLENIGDLMVRYGRKLIILKDERLNTSYQFPMPFDEDRPIVMIVDPRAAEGQFTIGTEMAQIPLRPRSGPDQSAADIVAGNVIDQQIRHQVQQNAQRASKGLPHTSRSKLDKARPADKTKKGRPSKRGGASNRGASARNTGTAIAETDEPATSRRQTRSSSRTGPRSKARDPNIVEAEKLARAAARATPPPSQAAAIPPPTPRNNLGRTPYLTHRR
jgi:hypothetical protein